MRDDLSLGAWPVIIGGRPESRGVVAAREEYGVRSSAFNYGHALLRDARVCARRRLHSPDSTGYSAASRRRSCLYREIIPWCRRSPSTKPISDVTELSGKMRGAHGRREGDPPTGEGRVGGMDGESRVGDNRLVAKRSPRNSTSRTGGLTVVRPERLQAFLDPLPRCAGFARVGPRATARCRWRRVGYVTGANLGR